MGSSSYARQFDNGSVAVLKRAAMLAATGVMFLALSAVAGLAVRVFLWSAGL